jgi:hypothetical protein
VGCTCIGTRGVGLMFHTEGGVGCGAKQPTLAASSRFNRQYRPQNCCPTGDIHAIVPQMYTSHMREMTCTCTVSLATA